MRPWASGRSAGSRNDVAARDTDHRANDARAPCEMPVSTCCCLTLAVRVSTSLANVRSHWPWLFYVCALAISSPSFNHIISRSTLVANSSDASRQSIWLSNHQREQILFLFLNLFIGAFDELITWQRIQTHDRRRHVMRSFISVIFSNIIQWILPTVLYIIIRRWLSNILEILRGWIPKRTFNSRF